MVGYSAVTYTKNQINHTKQVSAIFLFKCLKVLNFRTKYFHGHNFNVILHNAIILIFKNYLL